MDGCEETFLITYCLDLPPLWIQRHKLRGGIRGAISEFDCIYVLYIGSIMGAKGKPEIIDIMEKKRLQWCGHVKRMPEERILKLVME
jgi:hypothetical protein